MRRHRFVLVVAVLLSAVLVFVPASTALAKTARVFGDAVLANSAGSPGAISLNVVGSQGALTFTANGVAKTYSVSSASYGTSALTGHPSAVLSCYASDGSALQVIVEDGGQPGRGNDLVRTGSGMRVTLWQVTSGNLTVRLQ